MITQYILGTSAKKVGSDRLDYECPLLRHRSHLLPRNPHTRAG